MKKLPASLSILDKTICRKLIIRNNFWNIADNDFPYKDANGFEHALYWCNNIQVFYDNSQNNNYQVIFSVDL